MKKTMINSALLGFLLLATAATAEQMITPIIQEPQIDKEFVLSHLIVESGLATTSLSAPGCKSISRTDDIAFTSNQDETFTFTSTTMGVLTGGRGNDNATVFLRFDEESSDTLIGDIDDMMSEACGDTARADYEIIASSIQIKSSKVTIANTTAKGGWVVAGRFLSHSQNGEKPKYSNFKYVSKFTGPVKPILLR